jgi:hypothetical protein
MFGKDPWTHAQRYNRTHTHTHTHTHSPIYSTVRGLYRVCAILFLYIYTTYTCTYMGLSCLLMLHALYGRLVSEYGKAPGLDTPFGQTSSLQDCRKGLLWVLETNNGVLLGVYCHRDNDSNYMHINSAACWYVNWTFT